MDVNYNDMMHFSFGKISLASMAHPCTIDLYEVDYCLIVIDANHIMNVIISQGLKTGGVHEGRMQGVVIIRVINIPYLQGTNNPYST